MLSVENKTIMLSVIKLNVVMLNVVAKDRVLNTGKPSDRNEMFAGRLGHHSQIFSQAKFTR
jgi:hypothetical protein